MSVVELAMRARISDPKPYCCCVCMRGADAETRFIDFQASHDGIVVDPISGGVIARLQKVQMCESCLQEGCEVAALVPSLHQRHLQAVRELMVERDEARERYAGILRYALPTGVQELLAEVKELRAFKAEHDQSLVAQEA